jgi:hypothetical protein
LASGQWIQKEDNMKPLTKILTGAAIGTGILVASAVSASAAIACSGNVCWHTHEAFRYPREARIIIHDDGWKSGPSEHYTFREHEGRGYWRGDRWENW